MSTKEEIILENIFGKSNHFFDHKGLIHIGTTTGKPGHWLAHPFCKKRITGWIGFGELKYSKFDKICPMCLFIFMAKQIDNETREEKDGIIDCQARRILKLEKQLESITTSEPPSKYSLQLTGET